MSDSEGYRAAHLAKGIDYHEEFATNPRRALFWSIEQRVLRGIVERHLAGRPVRHLDFACGTGRVIALLRPWTADSIGVDVSASMLAVARANTPGARFVEADITREPVLPAERFDLITAFRFFPNAEPSLRDAAMRELSRRLSPGGLLAFNNHCHAGGLNRRLVRLVKRGRARLNDMSLEECTALIRSHGLECVEIHHMGVLPDYDHRLLRPRWLVSVIERIASRLPVASLAENLIFVCARRTERT